MGEQDTLNTLQDCCSEFNTFKCNSNETNNVKSKSSPNNLKSFRVLSGSHAEQINPIMLSTNDECIDIQSGERHTLFLTAKGKVYSIGSNDSGQCGLYEDIKFVDIPTLIPIKDTFIKQIACGELHNLFLNKSGKLLVCGFNYCGQLGITNEQAAEYYDNDDNESETSVSDSDSESDSDSDSDSD
eukprot:999713_1